MWDDDAGMREYRAFMKEWAPNEDIEESLFPYATAQIIVEVLKKCGDDLSRENLIKAGHQHSRVSAVDVPARPDDQRHPDRTGSAGGRPGWRVSTAPDGCCSTMSSATDDRSFRETKMFDGGSANDRQTEYCHRRRGDWWIVCGARAERAGHECHGFRSRRVSTRGRAQDYRIPPNAADPAQTHGAVR